MKTYEVSSNSKPIRWYESLYNRMLSYAEHSWAVGILALVAFSASIVLPFPPDPLFGLIALQKPRHIPLLVIVSALSASLGGLVMYHIGSALYHTLGVWILDMYGWHASFFNLQTQLHQWGFWLLVAKAFTPVPYKLLSLAYGVGHFNVWDFFVASFLGRGARYTIEGLIIWFVGPSLQDFIRKHLKFLLIAFGCAVSLGFALIRFF